MDASWQPDPTGRHQYRWWDGARWTDSVADDGQTATDPLAAATSAPRLDPGAPTPATPVVLPSSTAPTWNTPAAGTPVAVPSIVDHGVPPSVGKRRGAGRWIALGVVVVAALGVVGFLVLGKSDKAPTGAGTTTLEIKKDKPVVTRTIKVRKGEAYRIRVEPPKGMNTRSVLLLSEADAKAAVKAGAKFYGEAESLEVADAFLSDTVTDVTDLFTESSDLPKKIDGYRGRVLGVDGGDGKPDTGGIVAVSDATYTLAIASVDPKDTGKVKVIVEKFTGAAIGNADVLASLASDDPFFSDLVKVDSTRFTFELTKDKLVATREITVKRGDIVRIRVEPAKGMDTRTALLLSPEDTRKDGQSALEFYSEFYSDSGLDEFLSDTTSDASDLLSDGGVPASLRGFRGRELDHDGDTDEPDTGGIIALADVTYTLAVTTSDADELGTVTVFIERYEGGKTFSDYSDLNSLASDDSAFFSDTAFFSDSQPYTGS